MEALPPKTHWLLSIIIFIIIVHWSVSIVCEWVCPSPPPNDHHHGQLDTWGSLCDGGSGHNWATHGDTKGEDASSFLADGLYLLPASTLLLLPWEKEEEEEDGEGQWLSCQWQRLQLINYDTLNGQREAGEAENNMGHNGVRGEWNFVLVSDSIESTPISLSPIPATPLTTDRQTANTHGMTTAPHGKGEISRRRLESKLEK